MATTGLQFQRNDTDKTKINIGSMLRCGWDEIRTIHGTTPTAGNARPQFATVVQEGNSADELGTAFVCSGTIQLIGTDTVGILAHDAPLGTADCTYIIEAPRILIPSTASLTYIVGDDVYIDLTTFLGHNVATARQYIGKALKVKEANPSGLPAGDWVEIYFKQEQI